MKTKNDSIKIFHSRFKRLTKEEFLLIPHLIPHHILDNYFKENSSKYKITIPYDEFETTNSDEFHLARLVFQGIQRQDWKLIQLIYDHLKILLMKVKKYLKLSRDMEKELTSCMTGDLLSLFKILLGMSHTIKFDYHLLIIKLTVESYHLNRTNTIKEMIQVIAYSQSQLNHALESIDKDNLKRQLKAQEKDIKKLKDYSYQLQEHLEKKENALIELRSNHHQLQHHIEIQEANVLELMNNQQQLQQKLKEKESNLKHVIQLNRQLEKKIHQSNRLISRLNEEILHYQYLSDNFQNTEVEINNPRTEHHYADALCEQDNHNLNNYYNPVQKK